MEWDRVCPGCMKELTEDELALSACPHCGYDSSQEVRSYALPVRTILNGKYIIGKLLAVTEECITYFAYDLNLESKVQIEELFPYTILNREEGKTKTELLDESYKDEFDARMKAFKDAAKEKAHHLSNDEGETIREIFKENGTVYTVKVKINKNAYKNTVPVKIPTQQFLQMRTISEQKLHQEPVSKQGNVQRQVSQQGYVQGPVSQQGYVQGPISQQAYVQRQVSQQGYVQNQMSVQSFPQGGMIPQSYQQQNKEPVNIWPISIGLVVVAVVLAIIAFVLI